ncbi:MAG: ABC transporter ATP-binding protein [Bacteroidota bacterium]
MGKVIKVENLSKAYQLGDFGTGTISRDLERFWARMRGKEDPFLKIGEINDRTTKGESDIVWSLKDINFDVNQGDAIGIIGRNGAGKSTLLKVLSRVTSPTTGSIKVKGRIASLLEVGTGFHPELTGKENIYLNGAILGMRKAEIKRKFDEIVDFSGVERYIDTPVKRYSSGMYVRLAFAVAAHLESEILIVDEVLAVGDAEFQRKCLGKMGDVSKGQGRTVLFVSHNMDAVAKVCTKGIYLQDGQIHTQTDIFDTINVYLKKGNEGKLSTLQDYKLNNSVTIDKFKFDRYTYAINDDINFSLKITFRQATSIPGLALLFYDPYEKRVSVIDIRHTLLLNNKTRTVIDISGTIRNINLISNQYNIGLFLNSEQYSGDILNLIQIEIDENTEGAEFQPYPVSARGFVKLDYQFKIN